jgi:hypothetical protein
VHGSSRGRRDASAAEDYQQLGVKRIRGDHTMALLPCRGWDCVEVQ